MYRINNNKCIRRIAIKQLLANRTRNIMAVIAIALSTLLFTSLFTIGYSLLQTSEYSTMRQVGGTNHGSFKYLTEQMADKLSSDEGISNISTRLIIGGPLLNEELVKLHTEISYCDENYINNSFMTPTLGGIPISENEILISDIILTELGLSQQLNQTVKLKFYAGDSLIEADFVVVGIYETDPVLSIGQVVTSLDYAKSVTNPWQGDTAEPYFPNGSDSRFDYSGSYNISFDFDNSFNINGKMALLEERMGFDLSYSETGINWAYVGDEISLEFILLMVAVLIMIIFSGYLLIYNIFYISVGGDIRFYGLLKTIGTTPKQLGKIVYIQTLCVFIIGAPIGLFVGYLVGYTLLPYVLGASIYDEPVLSNNPMIFVFSLVFALLTVIISCRKPANFAGRLSPIEAMKHTATDKSVKKLRRSRRMTPINMALANLWRNRGKAILVVSSLSLSVLLFNITYTFVNGFDMDEYLSGYVVSDFLVTSNNIVNHAVSENTLDGITGELIFEVERLQGIDDIGRTYVSANQHRFSDTALKNLEEQITKNTDHYLHDHHLALLETVKEHKETSAFIYGVSDSIHDIVATSSDEIMAQSYLTPEQQQLFKTGNYVLTNGLYGVTDNEGLFYRVGEKVEIEFLNGKVKEYEVLSAGILPYAIDKRFYIDFNLSFILPEEEYLKQNGDVNPLNIVFDVEEEHEAAAESFLSSYTENIEPSLSYESKATYAAEFENLKDTFWATGMALSLILAFIGIINLVNTLITGIASRKIELAMLQSMGMTGRQLKRMIISEGLFYGISVTMFLLTIGNLATYIIVETLGDIMIASSYRFAVLPSVAIIILLGVVTTLTPTLIYNRLKKQSIVERLREVSG